MRFLRLKGDNRGFSIIEAVISAGIMAMMMVLIYGIYVSNFNMWEVGDEQAALQSKCRMALNAMVTELRNTTRTSTQTPSPNISIPSSPNNKQVHFHLPYRSGSSVSVSNDVIDWDTTGSINYQYIPGQKELRRLEGGTHTILADNVMDVQFIDQGIDTTLMRDELRIILTLRTTTKHNKVITVTGSARVKMRNST